MKKTEVEATTELAILTAMIVHKGVLEKIHQQIGNEKRPFLTSYQNLIARWCLDHFAKYQLPPRESIDILFAKWAEVTQDQFKVENVEMILSRLGNDYKAASKTINEKYVVDLASNYFEKIKLERYVEKIQKALGKNDLEEARLVQSTYRKADFSSRAWKDPFAADEIKNTFRYYEEDRSIFQFPGALGTFLSPFFERDGFISFAAPEKKGKSYWLIEVVWQALRQKRKILYYVLGDMSEDQIKKRLYLRATRRPFEDRDVRFPQSLKVTGDGATVTAQLKFRKGLTAAEMEIEAEKIRIKSASAEPLLKFCRMGGDVVSAGDIEQDVKQHAEKGWVVDLVVIDYADLLAPEINSSKLEIRHQMNKSWMILRRISLDFHCLVVTATQTARTSYGAWVIRKGDFSEDKRKNAHVTGMIGINQTEAEKGEGIYRLNWVLLRDGAWTDTQVVWTAGDLSIASPAMISSF